MTAVFVLAPATFMARARALSSRLSVVLTDLPPHADSRPSMYARQWRALSGRLVSVMEKRKRHATVGVQVGPIQVGGGAPVVVQSMTNTDTADIAGTPAQSIDLARAGSEMVRVTVNVPEAAAAVPKIKQRMLHAGVGAPLIGG